MDTKIKGEQCNQGATRQEAIYQLTWRTVGGNDCNDQADLEHMLGFPETEGSFPLNLHF